VNDTVFIVVWKYAEVSLIRGVFRQEEDAKQHCLDDSSAPIGEFKRAKRIDDKEFLYAFTLNADPAMYCIEEQVVR
jgi:hypothetical protein